MTNETLYEKLEKYEELKKENRKLKAELELARNLINSYYEENKHDVNKYLSNAKEQKELSDNAKRFVEDIIKEISDENNR